MKKIYTIKKKGDPEIIKYETFIDSVFPKKIEEYDNFFLKTNYCKKCGKEIKHNIIISENGFDQNDGKPLYFLEKRCSDDFTLGHTFIILDSVKLIPTNIEN